MGRPSSIGFCVLSLFLVCFALLSCSPRYESRYFEDWNDLAALPEDTGGVQSAFLGKDYPEAGNGFYVYLPAGWETSPIDYPTIFFFHGMGEVGNSNWDEEILQKVLANGPPGMIASGEWNPPVPFIVVSPQSVSSINWWHSFSDDFYQNLLARYPIDPSRIYCVGLSMGGTFVWSGRRLSGNKFLSAAGVCVSSKLWIGEYDIELADYTKTVPGYPLWEFHGEKDELAEVGELKDAVAAINADNDSFPVKLTVFPELNHSCWEEVFSSRTDTKTDPAYDPFDTDIYSWLLHYRRVEK